jgi:tetratricopeptide (TPR) repeat protein
MRILSVTAAICSFFFAIMAESQDASPLIRKADQLDAQERPDDAIEVLKQAEKISPNNPILLVKLSQDYSDKLDEAKDRSQKLAFAKLSLEYAEKAVHEAPDNADAHVCLSIAYGKMTDFTDNKTKMDYSKIVKSEAEKAVELNPKNDMALLILARWNFDMANCRPRPRISRWTISRRPSPRRPGRSSTMLNTPRPWTRWERRKKQELNG